MTFMAHETVEQMKVSNSERTELTCSADLLRIVSLR